MHALCDKGWDALARAVTVLWKLDDTAIESVGLDCDKQHATADKVHSLIQRFNKFMGAMQFAEGQKPASAL